MTETSEASRTETPVDLVRQVNLTPPEGAKDVLLHSCCAPCAGELMEQVLANDLGLTVFFYNPNIHPRREYLIRKEENIRFAEKLGVPFVDGDYDVQRWFRLAKGMEREPERGIRCTMCFDMRFDVTAAYAADNGFSVITSSLGLSRWKNMAQINAAGTAAASRHPGVTYWTYNWRKQGGANRMYQIAKREGFYAQQYCGCIYSLRDTNAWRVGNGRPEIEIGDTWYRDEAERTSR